MPTLHWVGKDKVVRINAQDEGTRRFLLVESQDYAETTTAERIRAVIRGYGAPGKFVKGLGGGFDYYTVGDPVITTTV